jgi:hypothetical protein
VLTIEEGEPIEPTRCKCCGGTSTTVTRFVYKDGNAHAAYFARLSDNHPERLVSILVGLGEWGEGTTEAQRRSFALEMRKGQAGFEVRVVDASSSQWPRSKVLGRTLNRDEALGDPRIADVFHITDHMVVDDALIRDYFKRPDA